MPSLVPESTKGKLVDVLLAKLTDDAMECYGTVLKNRTKKAVCRRLQRLLGNEVESVDFAYRKDPTPLLFQTWLKPGLEGACLRLKKEKGITELAMSSSVKDVNKFRKMLATRFAHVNNKLTDEGINALSFHASAVARGLVRRDNLPSIAQEPLDVLLYWFFVFSVTREIHNRRACEQVLRLLPQCIPIAPLKNKPGCWLVYCK